MIIGLTGTKASGKGVIADFLKNKGYEYSSISDRVREEAIKRGIENYSIKNLEDIGNELRKKYGSGILAKRTIDKINMSKNCVINGIRNIGEINTLRNYKNFFLIAVDADLKIRYERLIKRARLGDPKTWEEFLNINERDLGLENGNDIKTGQQVRLCIKEADFLFLNNYNTLKEAEKELLNKLNCYGIYF